MKQLKFHILAMLLIMTAFAIEGSAKDRMTRIYIFGISASFNDSIVYVTDIQELDSAYLTQKSKFLVGRDNYSYQLRDYLAEKGENHRTCFVSFAEKRKDIEKKYLKMRKRFLDKGNFILKILNLDEFAFQAIAPDEEP